MNDLKDSFRHVASGNVPDHSLCCQRPVLLSISSESPIICQVTLPHINFCCPLLVSSHKKMGKKDENLADLGEQNFLHACLRTLHWPQNLCDAAIKHGILFTRLMDTNNVFCNEFPKDYMPFVPCHLKILFAQWFSRNSGNLHLLVYFVPKHHAP